MIITRTPFRISFFGGGTDYPVWYENNGGGAVLSTSINKYCYISCRKLPPFFEHKIRVVWSKIEAVKSVDEIVHPTVREALKFVQYREGVEIHHDADLPARSGLGSSSTFSVGLLNALYALKGKIATKRELALDAIYLEQDRLKEYVGSQDQTIAAFGGFNKISFGGAHKISVEPVTISVNKINALQNRLMLFFTGLSRTASEIAEEQVKTTHQKKSELSQMHAMVDEAVGILNSNASLDEFGKLLDQSWNLKRSLTKNISTPFIDEIYARAKKAGALGGKLLGAGGGGFILFFVNPEYQPKVREELKELLYVPFKFEGLGSQVIYYGPMNNF